MASNSAIVARPDSGVLAIFLIIAVLLVSAMALGVASGVTDINIATVWKVTLSKVIPDAVTVDWTRAHERIIWELRLPRVLLAALTGAGLALSGAALQATTRNPLADPFLLGVSAGAALGAVAVISHLGTFAGIYSLPIAAFIGGALSLTLLVGVLGREGAARSDRVILAGVAISFLLMAGTNLLIFLGDQRASHSVVFWMLGGLGRARWEHLWIPTAAVLVGAIWLIWKARALNALMMGEESAYSLGIHTARLRLTALILTALMTSVLVSLTGIIGFVGLVVPHILRFWVGGDNRRLMPLCAIAGALFLVVVDIIARGIIAPQEAPIGIITGGVGGAYFCWLIAKRA